MGEENLVIRSEKVRLIDILSMLLLRRPLASYHFVDVGDRTAAADAGGAPVQWGVPLTLLIQKTLAGLYYPAKWFGLALEFFINFVAFNGGLLGIIWNIFRCKLVIQCNREAPNFRSIEEVIDGRVEEPLPVVDDDMDSVEGTYMVETYGYAAPHIRKGHIDDRVVQIPHLNITVMAAELAYQNGAHIKDVVNNVWKYNFVEFYSCWNKFVKCETTQAFVMTDRAVDASLVVLAFRGTEMFNMHDWATDIDLAWLPMGDMGHVHSGFLKALGLQEDDREDAARAFPRAAPSAAGGKRYAYYELRAKLREQLAKHPGAELLVTGHSLGGALAVIFPALLKLHEEKDILGRLAAVHTYGQPRAGDSGFAGYLAGEAAAYWRVVYRYDVVARVPFDVPPVAEFAHGGTCVYFDGWYDGRVLAGGAPNPNYINPRYLLSKYGNAWGDLFKAAFLWAKEGPEYREGAMSLLYRASGLLLPGVASHSMRDYVNAVRLGRIKPKPSVID